MKRPYESMVVFDGTLPEETLQKEQKKIEDLINDFGDFEKIDIWGKKALAYPVRKKRTGFYCLYLYSGSGDFTPTLDKHVKHNDTILRHLTVVRDLKNDTARQRIMQQKKERAAAENEKVENVSENKTEE
jgi:small subunit ribosomal protein S6